MDAVKDATDTIKDAITEALWDATKDAVKGVTGDAIKTRLDTHFKKRLYITLFPSGGLIFFMITEHFM